MALKNRELTGFTSCTRAEPSCFHRAPSSSRILSHVLFLPHGSSVCLTSSLSTKPVLSRLHIIHAATTVSLQGTCECLRHFLERLRGPPHPSPLISTKLPLSTLFMIPSGCFSQSLFWRVTSSLLQGPSMRGSFIYKNKWI